jgi:hypothetical protein
MTALDHTTSVRGAKESRRRALRRAPAAALVALAVLLIAVSAAGPIAEGSFAREVTQTHARLVQDRGATISASRIARSSIAWTGGPTLAATGETVTVYVSPALPPELGTPQTWADFIANLAHGPELSELSAYVGTFEEIQGLCGEHALGCYTANKLVSMGETTHGVTAAEVVRHEYGHHVGFHRLNPPWVAIDTGPKNWATAANVCPRAQNGTAYPGDEGARYSLNPGEAWAETYRLLVERRAGIATASWDIVDSSFFPTETALQAAERDVLQPWTAPRNKVFAHRFTSRGARVRTIPLTTPLDGRLELAVSLPKGGLQDVALLAPGGKQPLATALWSGRTTKTLGTNVCGERALRLRITQKGAFGRVRISATIP